MKTRFQTISLLGGVSGVCGCVALCCAPRLHRSRSTPAATWRTPAPTAIAAVPNIGIAMSAVPVPNYKLMDNPTYTPGVTPPHSNLLLACPGKSNGLGQSISQEVVREEGNEFVTVNGERVVAPPDMGGLHTIAHAFLWTHDKKHDLGTLSGGENSNANCINESGQVVGTSDTPDGSNAPVVWQSGKIRPLLTKGGSGEAYWINNRGDIAGTGPQACFWRGGKQHLIPMSASESSTATCINNRGDVVGYSSTRRNKVWAFVYRNGKTRRLSMLPGCTESWANSINDSGDIVGGAIGWKDNPAARYVPLTLLLDGRNNYGSRMPVIQVDHAVLWHDGICIDLNRYVPANRAVRLDSARGISNAGDIFGEAQGWNRRTEFTLKRLPDVHTPAKVQGIGSSARIAHAKAHP